MQAEQIAELFHGTCRRLAPSYDCAMLIELAVPWEDLPEDDQRLLIAVAGEVGRAIREQAAGDLRAIVCELYDLAQRGLEPLDATAYDAWEIQLLAALARAKPHAAVAGECNAREA